MARITKPIERKFFLPDDPDKAWVMIKHLSPGEVQDIFDKVFTQEISYKKVKEKDPNETKAKDKFEPEFSQKTDKGLDRELTLTSSVTGWGNFYGVDGKKAECTPGNIMEFSREMDGFIDFIGECREDLAESIKKEKEDQTKNLPSSASKPGKRTADSVE